MRVCILSPYPDFRNGLATYTEFLIQGLRKYTEILPIAFYRKGPSLPHEFLGIRELREIYSRIKKMNPSVIHVQFTTMAYPKVTFTLLLFLLKRLRKPVILTQHEVTPEVRKIKIRTIYERIVYGKADSIIAHTGYTKNYLLSLGIPERKIVLIPHGIQISRKITKRNARRKLNLDTEASIILIFGYLSPHKGIEYAIKAMPFICRKIKQAQLVIAGGLHPLSRDWDYLKRLKAMPEELGIKDKVTFVGYVEDELVPYLLRSADVLLLPYTRATESGILHLAMGAELPVVASNVKGLELINETGIGLQFAPCDSESIANAVGKLLKNRKLYQRCKNACRALAEERRWENVAKAHLQLYEAVSR